MIWMVAGEVFCKENNTNARATIKKTTKLSWRTVDLVSKFLANGLSKNAHNVYKLGLTQKNEP
jgi:hypothetical protein